VPSRLYAPAASPAVEKPLEQEAERATELVRKRERRENFAKPPEKEPYQYSPICVHGVMLNYAQGLCTLFYLL
jgi:hypothetical protein